MEQDIVDKVGDVSARSTNLATGAHPSEFVWGGYGVNSEWTRFSIQSPFTRHDLTKRPAALIRADRTYFRGRFRYTGSGWPTAPFATLPIKYRPAWGSRGWAADTAGNPVVVTISATGVMTVEQPTVGNIIVLDTLAMPRA